MAAIRRWPHLEVRLYIVITYVALVTPYSPPPPSHSSCTHMRDILPGTPIGGCRYPVLGDSIPTSGPGITILRPHTPTHAFVFNYGNACPTTFLALALLLLLLSDHGVLNYRPTQHATGGKNWRPVFYFGNIK